ncbi:hypothetical protein CVT24_012632 [Panaeolus cyanescens]|uniref:G domain-containing protein n=1 Tax=Panaeolus cyanescens TaxID=181874 RepID=A0A409WD02_9AGAR|nr:hypothetical protein CVT24_012632 [Panaeolus cyanescens]
MLATKFIQCLAGRDMGITSFGLEGFTQKLTAYHLKNAIVKDPPRSIVVVDTPGLEDPNISELAIIHEISKWAENHELMDNAYLLYFFPVNATRISGSKRHCLEIFKQLSDGCPNHAFIVTSMWNLMEMPSSRTKAEQTFQKLRAQSLWKRWVQGAPKVLKFHATHQSAMEVLHQCLRGKAGSIRMGRADIKQGQLSRLLYASTSTRLEELRQQEKFLCFAQALSYDDSDALNEETKRIAARRAKLMIDIEESGFSRPPTPPSPHTPPPLSPTLHPQVDLEINLREPGYEKDSHEALSKSTDPLNVETTQAIESSAQAVEESSPPLTEVILSPAPHSIDEETSATLQDYEFHQTDKESFGFSHMHADS